MQIIEEVIGDDNITIYQEEPCRVSSESDTNLSGREP